MAELIKSDLEFILQQIQIAEAHAAGADLKNTVQSDLATTGHDIEIPLNQRVLSYVELFQGRLHEFIEEGIGAAASICR